MTSQYFAFDRDRPPSAMELDTEMGLAEFQELEREFQRKIEQEQLQFAATQPMSAEMLQTMEVAPDGAARGASEDSEPLLPPDPALELMRPPPQTEAPAAMDTATGPLVDVTLSKALVMFRQGNRAAPQGEDWDRTVKDLHALCVDPVDSPKLPTADDMAHMTAVAQRLALRELLKWSADHSLLPQAVHLLMRLPPSSWSRI